MISYNQHGSYGWAITEALKGMVVTKDPEMQGYYRGCVITLAGEMVMHIARMEKREITENNFSEDYAKQVGRVKGLVENLLQHKKEI